MNKELGIPVVDEKSHSYIKEAAGLIAPILFVYLASWWSFKQEIKEQVWEEQDGLCADGCGKKIDEYHHIVPEKALRSRGIRGKNVRENAVGLAFDCHKHIWDEKMFHGEFYPGVSLSEIDSSTYASYQTSHRKKKRRRR